MNDPNSILPKNTSLKKKIFSGVKWLFMFSLAGTLLFFAFRGVKWQDFVNGLRTTDFRWVALSMLAGLGSFIARAFRWRLIMLPLNPKISRKDTYRGITIAYLTNFALPRAGEFARCGVISSTGKASFESALGTVVFERAVDLLCLTIIFFTVLVAKWNTFGTFVYDRIWAPALESAKDINISAIIIALCSIFIVSVIALFAYRNKIKETKAYKKVKSVLLGLKDGLTSGFKMKYKWTFLFYTLMLWVSYWLMSVFTLNAFPILDDMTAVDALFLMLVGTLGWIVPVQGGIGAFHFITSMTLSALYSVSQTEGIVFATISHESQSLVMIICGSISAITLFVLKRKKA